MRFDFIVLLLLCCQVYDRNIFGEWYSRNMYVKDSPEYKHHIRTYGKHTKFGYKDFIPLFTAERFDPDFWAGTFATAGAKYVVPENPGLVAINDLTGAAQPVFQKGPVGIGLCIQMFRWRSIMMASRCIPAICPVTMPHRWDRKETFSVS